ncbi:MAG: DUF309 domain-containing protein [Leptospiraceae bacterium]|nr:DUF309 domain-containing protein [Leptospiraceae bacterium]
MRSHGRIGVDDNRQNASLWKNFITDFNAGRYYAAHEQVETIWIRAGRPRSDWRRGLVQLAVALEHWKRGNRAGAFRVWRKARHILHGNHNVYFPHYQQIGEMMYFNLNVLLDASGGVIDGRTTVAPAIIPAHSFRRSVGRETDCPDECV